MVFNLGVAVFARTPGSGGKSRLAETWGRARTDAFYEHCLNCAEEWLEGGGNLAKGYWALTGTGRRDEMFWQNRRILEQGPGGLGERMAHVADLLRERHGCWCLVGTDIPQMSTLAELDLPGRLEQSDFVFGPAVDGGFWLAAGRRPLPRRVWTEVVYSHPSTLARLLENIHEQLASPRIDVTLPLMNDIDRQDDLASLLRNLEKRRAGLTPAQVRLLHWLRSDGFGCSRPTG